MILYILQTSLIFIFSFLLGSIIIQKTSLKNYLSFKLPVGFFSLLGLLQIGYFLITILNKSSSFFYIYTFSVFLVILLFSLICYKDVLLSLSDCLKNWKECLVIVLLVLLFTYLFTNYQINYRLDDLNFYGPFITNRVEVSSGLNLYDYQGFFVLLSILNGIAPWFSKIGIYTDFLPLGGIIWNNALFTIVILSITIVEVYTIFKKKMSTSFQSVLVTSFIFFIVYFNNYVLNGFYQSNTLRKFPIVYILLFIYHYFETDSKKLILPILLLFLGYHSISSSSVFLIGITLISIFTAAICLKKQNYILPLSIWSIPVFAFIYTGIPSSNVRVMYCVLLFIFYILLLYFEKMKILQVIESYFNKIGKLFVLFFPTLIFIFSYIYPRLDPNRVMAYTNNRSFFTNINSYDTVPDLFLFSTNNLPVSIFNTLFWVLILYYIVKSYIKNGNFNAMFICSVLLTFFNPIMYPFVGSYLTGAVFFRITDLILNATIFLFIIYFFYKNSKKSRLLILILCVIMSMMNIIRFNYDSFAKKDENFNSIYLTDQVNLNVMNRLENEYLKNQEFDSVNLASHIYGVQLFSKYPIKNVLNDRFAYTTIGDDEFEQIFYRRQPGIPDYPVSFNKACSYAFDKKLDYVILEAQYNWQLQEGLWSCSEVLFEEENYRVLKMNYDYWEWNIKEGYVERYNISEE